MNSAPTNWEKLEALILLGFSFIFTLWYTFLQGGYFVRLVYRQAQTLFPDIIPELGEP